MAPPGFTVKVADVSAVSLKHLTGYATTAYVDTGSMVHSVVIQNDLAPLSQ